MGKGKKTFKLKEYKVPAEKYLVVVNPWGLPETLDDRAKLNEVGAWFALLLRKDYPNSRVREIFFQKTHRNIIVELPREVDVERYLGGYPYSAFHRHIPCEDTRAVYLYEYRYGTFGNPAKRNWTGIIPTNDNIPAGLLEVLRDEFPLPSPAPPPPCDTPYARPISQNKQNILSTMRTSEDPGPSTIDGEGEYKPSAELLDLFDTLDRKDVKEMLVKDERNQVLPRLGASSSRTTMEAPDSLRYVSNIQVKPEPQAIDDDFKMSFSFNQRDPRSSMLLPGDGNSRGRWPTHFTPPIKRERSLEPEDEGPVLFRKRLKKEY